MKILTILFFICFNLFAEKLKINRDHSEFFFNVKYLKLGKVTGRFEHFSGHLWLENNLPHKIKLVIQSDSIDTGNGVRDGHLKSSSFLDSKKFPYITYESSHIYKEKNFFTSEGVLSFQNKKIKQKISFELKGPVIDTWKKESWFLSLEHQISRSVLDINWNKTLDNNEFILDDIIHINVQIQLQKENEMTVGSKHKISDNKELRLRERYFRGEITKLPQTEPSSQTQKRPSLSLLKESIPENVTTENQIVEKEKTKWPPFLFLSFLGFLAVIFISIFIKKNETICLWSEKQKGRSFAIEFLLMSLIFIYAIAVYELMPS